jgi:hypothetical protein
VTSRTAWQRIALYAILFVAYLASTVPVGLFIYSIKNNSGLQIFGEKGFHTYLRCLSSSFPLSKSAQHSKTEGREQTTMTLERLELLAHNARAASRAAALEALEYEREALKLRRKNDQNLRKSKDSQ